MQGEKRQCPSAHLPPWPFPPLCPSFASGPFPLSSSSPAPPSFAYWPATSLFLFILPQGFSCPFYLILISHLLSEKVQDYQDRASSLGPSHALLLGHLLSFFLVPCPSSASSWTLSLSCLCRSSEALHGCLGHRGQWASTHLANTKASSLLPAHSSKCYLSHAGYTALHRERGLSSGLRVMGRGQEHQSKNTADERQGKVQISADRILKV